MRRKEGYETEKGGGSQARAPAIVGTTNKGRDHYQEGRRKSRKIGGFLVSQLHKGGDGCAGRTYSRASS